LKSIFQPIITRLKLHPNTETSVENLSEKDEEEKKKGFEKKIVTIPPTF
jgi:hypothetical protein